MGRRHTRSCLARRAGDALPTHPRRQASGVGVFDVGGAGHGVSGPGSRRTDALARDLLTAGWHRIATARAELSGERSFWFYVHSSTSWKAVQAARKSTATMQFAEKSVSVSYETERTGPPTSVPVPMLWLFIPFFISCAGLWLEGKL